MKVTGNEILSISAEYLNEMRKNYLNIANLPSSALISVTFTTAQINQCLIPDAKGVGFIRLSVPEANPTWLRSTALNTDSFLVGVSVDGNVSVIDPNGGVVPFSTCPYEDCPPEPTFAIKILSEEVIKLDHETITNLTVKTQNTVEKFVSVYFSRKAIMTILGQNGCKGIMALMISDPKGYQTTAICGIDIEANYQIGNDNLIAFSDIYIDN
jgi:hypothetical protein